MAKLNERVEDFFKFYSEFNNKVPIKTIEVYASDFLCTANCKIDLVHTKVSVIGVLFSVHEIRSVLVELGEKFGIEIDLTFP